MELNKYIVIAPFEKKRASTIVNKSFIIDQHNYPMLSMHIDIMSIVTSFTMILLYMTEHRSPSKNLIKSNDEY